MASPALRIRVRCPSVSPAPVQLEGCTAQTTFAEFQGLVLRALGLESDDPDRQQPGPTILSGFPPRPLDLPKGAQIGSALSDNENVTVRLATQSAGGANPEGGKWGGRGRAKRPAASTASSSSSSTRRSTRASKSSSARATAAAEEGVGAGEGADADGDYTPPSTAEEPKPKPKTKPKPKGKASEKRPAATGSGSSAKNRAAAANGTGGGSGNGSGRGVHTLAGPLAPPPSRPAARSPTGASGGSSRAGPARGSLPGQVSTLFGSAAPRGGGSGAARPAAAAGPVAAAAAAAAAAGGADAPSRKRARGGKGIALKSEGDISECLLQAVGGGGKGVADRFFRKAMKLAVDKQYDQSRADARVRAALGGWYTAEASTTQRRLGDGESVALKISFSKGDGAKSQLEETVDRIPREQVAAVVGMIARDPESREMLKPHNFAGCSPRMFWSLVEYWGGDIPRALRLAAPSVDWGFVDTRDRKPSEKAVANAQAEELEKLEAEEERARKEKERAQKEKAKKKKAREMERKRERREGIETDSSEEEEEPSASTAAPTEPPLAEGEMEAGAETVGGPSGAGVAEAKLSAAAAADARSRAANAALRRLAASQDRPASGGAATATAATAALVEAAGEAEAAAATGMGVVAPTIASCDGPDKEGGGEREEEEVDMEGLIEVAGEEGAGLLTATGVRTIGQLADRDEEELTRQLGALQAGAGLPAGGGGSTGERVRAEEVAEWVQAARGEELDEIMAEIVGGDDDVVEALEEVAVSTPRDLVRLGAFPDVLIATVKGQVGAERFAGLEGRITARAVETWRRKGDRLLEQRPWLELWVHEG